MVFLCFSYGFPIGFPMVFVWFSYGFPIVFLWFSCSFLTVFLCFSYVSARAPFPLHFHSLLVAPGALWDPFWIPLGPPWAHLGVTWDPLGPFRRPLGPTLGGPWDPLGTQTEKHSKKETSVHLFGTPCWTKNCSFFQCKMKSLFLYMF